MLRGSQPWLDLIPSISKVKARNAIVETDVHGPYVSYYLSLWIHVHPESRNRHSAGKEGFPQQKKAFCVKRPHGRLRGPPSVAASRPGRAGPSRLVLKPHL